VGFAGGARGVVALLRADGVGAADIPGLLLDSFRGVSMYKHFHAADVIVYSHDGWSWLGRLCWRWSRQVSRCRMFQINWGFLYLRQRSIASLKVLEQGRQTLECFCSLHTRLATGTRRTLSRIRHRAPPPDLEQIEPVGNQLCRKCKIN
jgi:hypothetical protein